MKRFALFGFLVMSTFLLPATVSAGPQWACNRASYECKLYRQGMTTEDVTRKAIERFPEYKKYVDECGVGSLVTELMNQCPEYLPKSSSLSGGGSSGSQGCKPSHQQIYNLATTVKSIRLQGQSCTFFLSVH